MGRKELLLAGIAAVFALSADELAARLLLDPPLRLSERHLGRNRAVPKHVADANLGWALLSENAKYRYQASGKYGSVDAHYSIENGHRATASHPLKGPLLIATGCSFTFGMGVSDEDTWPWLLQERLPGYHVVNTGVGGYGTDQALLAADQLVQHSTEPTRLVVLGFADFQIDRNRSTQGMLYQQYPFGKPLFVARGTGVQLSGLVRFWYPGSLLEHSVLFMEVLNRLANIVNRAPSHEGAREVTARLMVEFARRFQARGARLAVVLLPHAWDRSPVPKADQKFIVDRLHAAGIPTLVPEFPRMADGRLEARRFFIPSDGIHPNGAYNLLLADQVAKFLTCQRLSDK